MTEETGSVADTKRQGGKPTIPSIAVGKHFMFSQEMLILKQENLEPVSYRSDIYIMICGSSKITVMK